MTHIITALKVQKKNTNRVNVFLDGEFAFGLARITAAWLRKGQKLSSQEIESLKSADEIEVAYQRALNYLSYKPRTAMEVKEKLFSLNFSAETIESVCSKLVEKGYINDHQFAELWVENRKTFRPRSHKMISWELRKKKINEEIITTVLEFTDSDEELARLAAEKYASRLHDCDRDVFFRRLAGYLGRRGFSYSIVSPIIHHLWETKEKTKNTIEMENEENYGE
jgi:regulatory protein